MRYAAIGVAIIGMVLMFNGSVSAQQTLIDSVAKGCDQELKTYCKDVTPGEGRVLACLYAFSDKLSGKCEYALYDAAAQLERAVAILELYRERVPGGSDEVLQRHQTRRGTNAQVHGEERCEDQQAVQAGLAGHGAEKISMFTVGTKSRLARERRKGRFEKTLIHAAIVLLPASSCFSG